MINVLGDSIGAGIVYHLSKSDLNEMKRHHHHGDSSSSSEDNETMTASPTSSKTDVVIMKRSQPGAYS